MQTDKLTISLMQYDIAWEDKQKNLAKIEDAASKLAGKTDLIILPEMSFTGFSFNLDIAEPSVNTLFAKIKDLAIENKLAICGSALIEDKGQYHNRAFFITPQESHFYDKRHLFRMGGEGKIITAGKEKIIFNYKGFNICLLVCYDLRFPVWSRNRNNEYDLAIYIANWPEPRQNVWDVLLRARAMENMCYVCGVNRVGLDGNQLSHLGGSALINEKGNTIIRLKDHTEIIETVVLDKESLTNLRHKFPVWKDADDFEIKI